MRWCRKPANCSGNTTRRRWRCAAWLTGRGPAACIRESSPATDLSCWRWMSTTGKPAPGFGNEGRVDLKKGVLGDLKDGRYALQSPPAVFGDVVITGCSNGEGSPTRRRLRRHSRLGREDRQAALDLPHRAAARRAGCGDLACRTPGRIDRAPTPGASSRSMSKRGIVYAPLGSPTSDFYGEDRVGDGLYGNSLVALDARTGEKKWHRQLVHHDLWDYDLAAPPALFDIRRDGRVIPAVAQITKMGLLFVFDRVTGEPVYGMEERPVPQTAIPGEVTSKTQPFPVKPPPLAKNTFRMEEMYDRSPEHARFCKELFASNQMKIGPPVHAAAARRQRAVLSEHARRRKLGRSVGRSLARPAVRQRHECRAVGPHGEARLGVSCGPPPMDPTPDSGIARRGSPARIRRSESWSRSIWLPATSRGDPRWAASRRWRRSACATPGSLNLGGSIATAGGLVFIGATNDSRFRAFDSKTGKLLWETKLEASGALQPDHLHGPRRPTICRADGRRRRSVPGRRAEQYAGRVRAAGCSPQAAAGFGDEGRSRGRRGAARTAAGRRASRRPLLPPGGAKALVEKTCGTGCHSVEVVTSQRMNAKDWNAIVQNMVARGAQASDAEVKAIVRLSGEDLGKHNAAPA